MKTLGLLRVLEMLCLVLCTWLCLPDTWTHLLHSWRLQEAAREWRAAGPHTTLVGRLRERLAAAGWLAPPRDPLLECGVPLGRGWTEMLQRLYGADSYLSCLEKEMEQAQQEHLAFRANLLLVASCAFSVTVLAALLAVCGCLLLRLARQQQQQQQQQPAEAAREVMPPGEAPRGEVQPRTHDLASPVADMARECHDMASPVADMARECHGMASPVADMARECHGMASPVADMARECQSPPVSSTRDAACDPTAQATGRQQEGATPGPVVTEGPLQVTGPLPVQAAQAQEPPVLDTPPKEGGASLPHEAGGFGPSSQDQGRETPAAEEEPCKPPPVQEAPLEADEAAPVVRRGLYVPPRFRLRLEGPDGSFLEHLGRRYGVLVFTNPAKKKMQIRGAKQRVLDCYEVVRALLAEWQAQDPPPSGEAEVKHDCRRAGHGRCQTVPELKHVFV